MQIPSRNRSSRRPSERNNFGNFEEAPVYIKGFPGFGNLGDASDTSGQPMRFDLHEYQGTSDLDDLVDKLQLREDSNDMFASRKQGLHPQAPPPLHHQPLKRNPIHKTSSFSASELSTLFSSMFHTQFCKIDKKHISTPQPENLKRFFLMYMRNWESILECSRTEKLFISDFKKKQHDKLTKDEWNYLCSFIKRTDFNQTHQAFQDFCFLLRNRTSNSSASSSPSSSSFGSSPPTSTTNISSALSSETNYWSDVQPSNSSNAPSSSCSCISATSSNSSSTSLPIETFSGLSRSLMTMNSLVLEDLDRTINLSMEEIKRLYICIYFPNYQEFWSSDVFILSGSMMKSIDSFLEVYPTMHSGVLNSLLTTMNQTTTKDN